MRTRAVAAAVVTAVLTGGATAVGSIGTAAQAQPFGGYRAGVGSQAAAVTAAVPSNPASMTWDKRKVVYLTFDDGPDPRFTPQVLRVLRQYRARATFFMIGSKARNASALVRRVKAEGHAVANHTYTHPWLTRRSPAAIRAEIRRTDAVLGRTRCLRPPGGFVNRTVRSVVASEGKRLTMWTVDPADWSRPGAKAIEQRVVSKTRPGSVVVMHDGGGQRQQTVAALPNLLRRLAAQGYRFDSLPACR